MNICLLRTLAAFSVLVLGTAHNSSTHDTSLAVGRNAHATQTGLSGRERLGLVDMTPATNGVLKCTLEDVFGKRVSKETTLKILRK